VPPADGAATFIMHDLNEDRHNEIRSGKRVTLGGMAVNAALTALKFLGGFYGGSKALLADALHSLSDLISDFLALVGLHFYRKGKDRSHPYGHGKIETLSTLGIGILLLGAAVWIGIDAARTIYNRVFATPHLYTIWIAGFSILSKEVLYQITSRTAIRIKSEVMAANAWHHRTDAITSVVALAGIALARFVPSLIFLDSYAAILVSFFIIKIGVDIIRGSVDKIIDTALPKQLIEGVEEEIKKIEGVIGVHDTAGRYYADSIAMEAHIEVDGGMTVDRAHRIANLAERRVRERFDSVTTVLVHVDPYRDGHAANGRPPADPGRESNNKRESQGRQE